MYAKFNGCSESQIKWGGTDDPAGLLEVGEIYKVDDLIVRSYHTKVILAAFPEHRFNSVCFDIKKDKRELV